MILPCHYLFADKCLACRELAGLFYAQFEVPVTDEQVKGLQEQVWNEPGDLLLDKFWGSTWPVGRGAEVGEEIRRRVLAYDRLAAEIKRLYLTVL